MCQYLPQRQLQICAISALLHARFAHPIVHVTFVEMESILISPSIPAWHVVLVAYHAQVQDHALSVFHEVIGIQHN